MQPEILQVSYLSLFIKITVTGTDTHIVTHRIPVTVSTQGVTHANQSQWNIFYQFVNEVWPDLRHSERMSYHIIFTDTPSLLLYVYAHT